MLWKGDAGESKLDAGKRQLNDALKTLGADHWVSVNAATTEASEFKSLETLIDSSAFSSSGSSAQISTALQRSLEYLQLNKPGAAPTSGFVPTFNPATGMQTAESGRCCELDSQDYRKAFASTC